MTSDKRLGIALAAIVLIINLLAILLGAGALNQHRTEAQERVEIASGNLVQVLAYRITAHAQAVDATLQRVQRRLERDLAAGRIDAAALTQRIADELELLPLVEGIRVSDAEGNVRWGNGLPEGGPLNMTDRPFFAEHRAASASQLIVAPPQRGHTSGRWVLPFTRAYRNPDGTFAGVIAVAVPVDHIAPQMDGIDLGAKGTIVIRYADMGLVARVPPLPGPAGEPGHATVSDEFRALVVSGRPAAIFRSAATPDSVERTYAARRVEGLPLMVAVGQASDEYLEQLHDEVVMVGLVLLALALLSGGAAWAGMRYWRERSALLQANAHEATRRRVLIDNSRDGIAIHDQAHRVIECNARFAAMLGYTPAEALQLYTWDFEATMSEADIRRAFADLKNISATFETRHRRKDGSEFEVEVSANGVVLDEQAVVITVSRDISERKAAEARLRQLAQAVEQSPAAIVITDLEARIEFVNQAFTDITGFAREEAIGQRADALQLAETPAETIAEMWEALRGGTAWKGEFVNRRKDGSRYAEFAIVAPIRRPNGVITHYVAIKEDITEKKRIGSELDLHRRHLEQLVAARTREIQEINARLADTEFAMDRVGMGIHWVEADTGRYLYCNPQGAAMLGYTPEEFLRITVADVVPRIPPGGFAAVTSEVRETGGATREVEHRQRDGRLIPIEVTLYFLEAREGWPPRIVAFLTDITRRKAAAEELLRAKEQAETANIAKSAFLANMSHEIRTPLNAITGMAHLIRRSGVPPEQADRLAKIDAAGQHLLEIINAVLDLSKIEAGKFTLEDAPLTLGEIAANVVAMVQQRAHAKGLLLFTDVEALPYAIRGDATRLQQGLLNYATNAVKFTARGGITLRAKVAAEDADSVLLRFEVEDSGIGIAADAIPRLFHAFEQADNSTTRQYGGTGLGLAITRRIAELMGGQAGVESEAGKGSTFWFTARLRKAELSADASGASGADSAEAVVKRDCAGKHILVVDDEPINREIAVALIEEAGLRAEVATDGREALNLARERRYDLILMDMQMPYLDGLDATGAIRALPGPRVPIVAMTANAFAEDRDKCLAAGMDDYLPKPMHPDALYAMLCKWLVAPSRQG